MNPKMRLLISCSILSISANLNYGFSTTYLNIPIDYFKDYLNKCLDKSGKGISDTEYNIVWNLLLHCWFLGFFVGIWLNPYFNESFGRKKTFVIFSIMNFISSVLRAVAIQNHYLYLLFAARLMASASCSVIYQTQLLFLQECSPSSSRGVTSFLSGIWFAVVAFLTMFLNLDWILGKKNTVAFWSILMSSTYFLLKAGIENGIAQASTTMMGGMYFLGTVGGMFWISKVKRRTIVIWFTLGNTATLGLYCVFSFFDQWVNGLKYGCLFCFLAYGFTYGAGAGPVNRFIGGELVSQSERSMLQALSMTVNQTIVIITTFAILPLFDVIDSFALLVLFVIPSIGCLLYLYFKLPETKNRAIDEIVEDLCGKKEPNPGDVEKF